MKTWRIVLLIMAIIFLVNNMPALANQPLAIQIDGSAASVPAGTHVAEGQVMVPIRWAAGQLGAYAVLWDPERRNIDIKTNEDFYRLEKLSTFDRGLQARDANKEAEMWPLPERAQKIALPHLRDRVLVLNLDSWIQKYMNKPNSPFPSKPISITVINDGQSYAFPVAVNCFENIDGHFYVPMDFLELLFYAKVNYDEQANRLSIQTPDLQQVEQQLAAIEDALIPATPEEAMQLWGRGEQTRSGSIQYMVLSPELRQQANRRIREAGWVTGGSSPWVGPITVQEEKKLGETATEFTVTFPEITSAPPNPTATERFVVEQLTVNGKTGWFITKMLRSSCQAPLCCRFYSQNCSRQQQGLLINKTAIKQSAKILFKLLPPLINQYPVKYFYSPESGFFLFLP